MECQSLWRYGGIFRDVYLFATPETHLRDYFVRCDFDEDYSNAMLKISAEVINYTQVAGNSHVLEVHLYDPDGNSINTIQPLKVEVKNLKKGESRHVELSSMVKNPLQWSADQPHLYQILFITKRIAD